MQKLPESIESSRFASNGARIPGELDSRKDLHPIKFKRRHRILIKLRFKTLCDSKLSGLRAFDDTTILLSWKRLKSERWAVSSWDIDPWGYSQGKSTVKHNSSAYEKYEYGHFGRWYIKSTLFKEVLKLKQKLQKN